MTDRYLSRKEASAYITARGLSCAATTLQKYATVGGGPHYRKFGKRAVYAESDLDSWIESKLTAPMASSSAAA